MRETDNVAKVDGYRVETLGGHLKGYWVTSANRRERVCSQNLFLLFELSYDGFGQHLTKQSIAASAFALQLRRLGHETTGEGLSHLKEYQANIIGQCVFSLEKILYLNRLRRITHEKYDQRRNDEHEGQYANRDGLHSFRFDQIVLHHFPTLSSSVLALKIAHRKLLT